MKEKEYINVYDTCSVRRALDSLGDVIPESNPNIDSKKYRRAYCDLYDIWEELHQNIEIEE